MSYTKVNYSMSTILHVYYSACLLFYYSACLLFYYSVCLDRTIVCILFYLYMLLVCMHASLYVHVVSEHYSKLFYVYYSIYTLFSREKEWEKEWEKESEKEWEKERCIRLTIRLFLGERVQGKKRCVHWERERDVYEKETYRRKRGIETKSGRKRDVYVSLKETTHRSHPIPPLWISTVNQ